jgi:uridine phosphorylase
VICFFDEVVRAAVGEREPTYRLRWEHGFHGVWDIERDGERLAICHPGCGAPLAGANLDVLVAMGCDRVIACGGAGTVAAGFDMGHAVVAVDAVRDEGCLTVEMEAAALFAVAAFRGVAIGQLLYCGDDLSTETWDHRGWDLDVGVRQRLFEIACGACLRL